jgi:hypothetical protein
MYANSFYYDDESFYYIHSHIAMNSLLGVERKLRIKIEIFVKVRDETAINLSSGVIRMFI